LKEAAELQKKRQADKWLRAVGDNVRRERKTAGLTQEKLAELADLAPRVIQKIEAGQITILISTLRRLRKAIGCPYERLLEE
jgi:transcriptional regulator with XRE-family HTH domain